MDRATNVVRLPTAPRNKVKQNHNRAARAERQKLPRFTGEFIFPSEREMMKTAEALMEIQPSPELELLTAICSALDDETRAKVAAKLAPGFVVGRRTSVQAMAVFRSTRMTIGDSVDLDNAMRRLREQA